MSTTSSELYVHHTIELPEGQQPWRLDKLLREKLANVSRTRLQVGIKEGNILVNGKKAKASYQVRPLDVIKVLLPRPPRTTEILPENLPLDIVYEDDDVIVVNKAAPMVVHPAHENWTGTLVNALLYHFGQLPAAEGNEARPGLVHRIDKGTSGLLVVAKREESLAHLARQFYDHTVGRRYLALVWGDVKDDEGTISVPLGRSKHDRRIMVGYEEGQGKASITHYKVVKRWGYVTLVMCELETGRTHQIRAHMKHIGHPLFGDPRYGGDYAVVGPRFSKYLSFIKNCFEHLPYQALHAQFLQFIHPVTKEKMTFEVAAPDNFAKVIDKWDRYKSAE